MNGMTILKLWDQELSFESELNEVWNPDLCFLFGYWSFTVPIIVGRSSPISHVSLQLMQYCWQHSIMHHSHWCSSFVADWRRRRNCFNFVGRATQFSRLTNGSWWPANLIVISTDDKIKRLRWGGGRDPEWGNKKLVTAFVVHPV